MFDSAQPIHHTSSLSDRRLFVLYCEYERTIDQWFDQITTHDSDLKILSNISDHFSVNRLREAHALLGTTLKNVVLDFRDGFPLDYFLSVSNAVCAGGSLVLMIDPNFRVDNESIRFHVKPLIPIHFNQLLREGVNRWAEEITFDYYKKYLVLNQKREDLPLHILTPQQQTIKAILLDDFDGVSTLFAPRGSGKSYLSAEIVATFPERFILTAPNQQALLQYHQYLAQFNFRAPDDLFLNGSKAEFNGKILLVEEAAKMPLKHLERLCDLFNSVLLISSVENYEGTGQGLREKIYDLIAIRRNFTLTKILRFNPTDPLTQFSQHISLNNDAQVGEPTQRNQSVSDKRRKASLTTSEQLKKREIIQYKLYNEASLGELQANQSLIEQIYHLFDETHYQTNIQDLRRLLDADHQIFITTQHNTNIIGAIWGILEGEQNHTLALDLFRGLRRPKGNLVPQTLSAHSYYPEAMEMSSIRISRISVMAFYRHRGIASRMIHELISKYQAKKDFISVSFGLTEGLLYFWEQCGFHWIHIGTHQEKTTGLHAAIMIYPLSKRAEKWLKDVKTKWLADLYYLRDAPFIREKSRKLFPFAVEQPLDDRDISAIEAYKNFRKSKTSVYSALKRYEKINC